MDLTQNETAQKLGITLIRLDVQDRRYENTTPHDKDGVEVLVELGIGDTRHELLLQTGNHGVLYLQSDRQAGDSHKEVLHALGIELGEDEEPQDRLSLVFDKIGIAKEAQREFDDYFRSEHREFVPPSQSFDDVRKAADKGLLHYSQNAEQYGDEGREFFATRLAAEKDATERTGYDQASQAEWSFEAVSLGRGEDGSLYFLNEAETRELELRELRSTRKAPEMER